MYKLDAPSIGVSPVKFKKGKAEELVNYLQKEHSQAFRDRAGHEEKWNDWLSQANSRRKDPSAKPRDAQIDSTLTARKLVQHKPRLSNPIFQQDQLMVAHSRKNMHHEFALELEEWMDYVLDKPDMQRICEEWIDQFQVFPAGFIKTAFTKEVKHIRQWEPIDYEMYAQLEEEGQSKLLRKEMTDDTYRYYIETDKRVVTKAGVYPEVIPIEDIVCPIATATVDSADWFSHRFWPTKPTVQARIREGVYDEKDQNGDKILDALGNPSAHRKKLLDHSLTQKADGDEDPSSKQYEVLETYLSYDYDGSGTPKEIIVTWDRKSGALLRAVDNFYQNFCRPFVPHSFKDVHGSLYGIPATFILEPLHVAHSASIRQRLDAASKANEVIVTVPKGSAPDMKSIFDRDGITGGLYEVDAEKNEINQFSLSQPYTQLPELESLFEQWANDLMSLSDYSYGREQIDRPTATGQTSIIEESKQPLYSQLERFRKSFATVVMHMLARYRQFYPEGLEYYLESLDPESGQELERMFLEWPDEAIEDAVVIETKVTSAQMSKHLRKQEVVALLDRVPQMYETMMGMAQQAANPGPGSMISVKLLLAYQSVVEQFLTEFEVPGKEELNPELMQEVQVAQMVQQKMQEMQQQVQSMGQQLQNAQGQLAALQGGGMQGPGMGGQPGPQPGVQGPPGMGGPPAGP